MNFPFAILALILILFLCFHMYTLLCLFLAALGLRPCTWAFSSRGERGLLFLAMGGLLVAVASLVVEHGLHNVWVRDL